jgi:16S rRNA (uracil1498-N3)-methyltransferase
MQLFFTSGVKGDTCSLSEEESLHCIKVLRFRPGDPVDLTDGRGKIYSGTLIRTDPKGCEVRITRIAEVEPDGWHLHIAIAPTKSTERFEWFLEKATEIGIHEITPVICEHSEREVIKPGRLEKVLLSAMKQSLRAWLPRLNEAMRFRDMMELNVEGQKLIAYCGTGNEPGLHKVYRKGSGALILIGPEGDFSDDEVELALASGFLTVGLGPGRLRTETAGIAACHAVNLMNR